MDTLEDQGEAAKEETSGTIHNSDAAAEDGSIDGVSGRHPAT
jgi:hypothetical protein